MKILCIHCFIMDKLKYLLIKMGAKQRFISKNEAIDQNFKLGWREWLFSHRRRECRRELLNSFP